MEELRIVSQRRYLIQKIILYFPELKVSAEGRYSGGAARVLFDIDTAEGEAPVGAITVGEGGMLPYPFVISELKAMLCREKSESAGTRLYPLRDGTGVYIDGRTVRLTEVEMRLFRAIYEGGFTSREELTQRVWGEGAGESLLNVYIHYLRSKLETTGDKVIVSARGRGYSFADSYREEN